MNGRRARTAESDGAELDETPLSFAASRVRETPP